MTCSRCTHQFCWLCLSAWNGGCSAPKRCKVIAAWTADLWGSHPIQRGVTRSLALVAVAPATGLAIGLAATGVGCVTAAGAVVGALSIPLLTVTAVGRSIQQGIYSLRKHTYPILVHLPWNRRVTWCDALDGETEMGTFLGYEGRHHPCGIFVSKLKLSTDELGIGWKHWFKYGPSRLQGKVTIVIYLIPNGTTKDTLTKMLPDYATYPSTAYPGSSYVIQPAQYDSLRERFQSRLLSTVEDFLLKGGTVQSNPNHRGLMDDPEDYGLPEPGDEHALDDSSIFSDITRCPHCTVPKFFTNYLLYQTHMATEHPTLHTPQSSELSANVLASIPL